MGSEKYTHREREGADWAGGAAPLGEVVLVLRWPICLGASLVCLVLHVLWGFKIVSKGIVVGWLFSSSAWVRP